MLMVATEINEEESKSFLKVMLFVLKRVKVMKT